MPVRRAFAFLLVTLLLTACNARTPVVDGNLAWPPPSTGGEMRSFHAMAERHRHMTIALDGTHLSASTLYLGMPRVCATDNARFGFHGPTVPSGDRSAREAYNEAVEWVAQWYSQRSPALGQWYRQRFGGSPGLQNQFFVHFTRDELNRQFQTRIPRC